MHPEIHLLRHGQTDWNAIRRIQGQRESDLTETGRGHATRQGEILRELGLDQGGVTYFCSPLRRTRQTAALALPDMGDQIIFDDRLKEIFMGDWEGYLYSEAEVKWPSHFASLANMLERCLGAAGGEGYESAHGRARSFIDDLQGPAVIVAHGAINMILRGLLTGLSRDEMGTLSAEQGVVIRIRDGKEDIFR